jgi:hypothetical protein
MLPARNIFRLIKNQRIFWAEARAGFFPQTPASMPGFEDATRLVLFPQTPALMPGLSDTTRIRALALHIFIFTASS